MGPKKCDTEEECLLRVERCSPRGAPQEPDGERREEPKSTSVTNTSGSLEPTILSRIMPTYSLLVFKNDDIQEFDSKSDGILLSMTKIPLDDILEGLYKL